MGSWAGWLVRVWSLTRSNKDEENELIVNWMWSGLLLSDNATYCTAAAVEPHHQHIAPWPLLFPPLLCPCKTLPPSEMLLSGHQRSKQWASAIKALILFSHQYQTCNLLYENTPFLDAVKRLICLLMRRLLALMWFLYTHFNRSTNLRSERDKII